MLSKFQVNAVNASGSERTAAQVEKKWIDLKSISKKAIATWNKHIATFDGSSNMTTPPTEMQWKIVSLSGIEGLDQSKDSESESSAFCTFWHLFLYNASL